MDNLLPSPRGFDEQPDLIFRSAVDGTARIVEVSGEVDMTSSEILAHRLSTEIGEGVRVLVVDLSQVSFFSSNGVKALFAVRDDAAAHDVALRIALGHNRRVRRVLEITGLDKVFAVYDSQEDAVLDR